MLKQLEAVAILNNGHRPTKRAGKQTPIAMREAARAYLKKLKIKKRKIIKEVKRISRGSAKVNR